MLILKAASLGPLHGYGILLRIQRKARIALGRAAAQNEIYRAAIGLRPLRYSRM